MHTAHNVAYANIHTELNTCIDSDDIDVYKRQHCWMDASGEIERYSSMNSPKENG